MKQISLYEKLRRAVWLNKAERTYLRNAELSAELTEKLVKDIDEKDKDLNELLPGVCGSSAKERLHATTYLTGLDYINGQVQVSGNPNAVYEFLKAKVKEYVPNLESYL